MLPYEASHLYDWASSSRLSYGEFLRNRQFDGLVRFAIDNQYKSLIATIPQLAEHGIEVASVSLDRGFTMLSKQSDRESEALADGSAESFGKLNWGFIDDLISQGQMNTPLAELLRQSKAPSHNWAYEQFEIGRDEFRRQLYPEALQSVTRAIVGQEDHPGIKTDFRLHFLLGMIRLGSYTNTSSEVVNPQLAQEAFLTAARCAQALHPGDAGLALICAGRAALLADKTDNALEYTRKGLSFLPQHAAGIYQLGRGLFLKGVQSEATDRLADAILLNVEHALHACGDPDFNSRTDFLNKLLGQAQKRYRARYKLLAEQFRRAEKELRHFTFEDVPAETLHLKGLAEIQKMRKAADAQAATKTLYGYSSAISRLLEGFQLFPGCFEEFKAKCIEQLQERIKRPPRREDFSAENLPLKSRGDLSTFGPWLASALVSGMTIFVVHACQTSPPSYLGLLEATSDMFLLPLMYGACIATVLALLEYLYREYLRSRTKSALAAYDAAWYDYTRLKDLLTNEMATIQGMSLPKECQPPSLTVQHE